MQQIELMDLPAIVAELLDEIEAGGGPFEIVSNGKAIAIMQPAEQEGRATGDTIAEDARS